MKEYLSARDLADDLGISTRRIKKLVEAKQLTACGRLRSGQRPYIFDPVDIRDQLATISRRKKPAQAD